MDLKALRVAVNGQRNIVQTVEKRCDTLRASGIPSLWLEGKLRNEKARLAVLEYDLKQAERAAAGIPTGPAFQFGTAAGRRRHFAQYCSAADHDIENPMHLAGLRQ